MSGGPEERPDPNGAFRRRAGRYLALLLLAFGALTVLWWLGGRLTAPGRRLEVRQWREVSAPAPDSGAGLRVLAWNLAHGRGDAGPGLFRNWAGGSREARTARLARIAHVLERVDADVVVLNEVDFRSSWSGGLNQAEVLARAAGYPVWVEQRNFDVRLPFAVFSFGNAVLTRRRVEDARWVEIPADSRLLALAVGAKGASVVRVVTGLGPVALIPVHLDPTSGRTRRGAVPSFEAVRSREPIPMVLAGDFNASPPGWPGAGDTTVVGELLERGWTSPRAGGSPGRDQWTFPTFDPGRAIDWVLVEPPLRVIRARVLEGTADLSDHAPVLAVIERAPEG